MFNDLVAAALIAILVGTMVLMLIFAVKKFIDSARRNDREYMDPLPPVVQMLWPIIQIVAGQLERLVPVEYMTRLQTQLERAGLSYLYSPVEFISLQMVTAIAGGVFGWFGLSIIKYPIFPLILGFIALGFWMPSIAMKERRQKRAKEIVKMLPIYLDFITLSVEAGLSLSAALVQATRKGPDSLLKLELERVNSEVKAGNSRIAALQAMSNRLEIREITTLVNALTQAEKTGASIGNVLRLQADQRLIERFQRAEKLAMEAPVKLIFPLVMFIFPCTFVILGFPIVMKLIHHL